MTCQEFLDSFSCLIDNHEEPVLFKAEAEAHMKACPSCLKLYQQHVLVERSLRCLPRKEAPAGMSREIMAILPARQKRPQARVTRPARLRMLGATAAVVLLLGSPLFLVQQSGPLVSCEDPNARIEITANHVVVPVDAQVMGNLKVVNAKLTVLGAVNGQITLIQSSLTTGPLANVESVEIVSWSWLERLAFSLTQMREDLRSFVRGAWR